MITDIPSPDDFNKSSRDLLRLAWEIAQRSLHWYNNSDVIHERYTPEFEVVLENGEVEKVGGPDATYTPEEREAAARQYWEREQPALSNALVLVQQAIELGLKGRVAAVSPFLLIARDPREFPDEGTEEDISFSTFRTIDAKDLLRIHNAVAPKRLGRDVSTFWKKIRKQRNAVMHLGWTNAPPISAQELVFHILFANHFLDPETSWPKVLLERIDEPDLSFPYDDGDSIGYGTVLETISDTTDQLPPSLAKRYFGFDPKCHSYDCPHCYERASNADIPFPALAQLRPRSPTSTALHCFVCERTTPVRRQECQAEGCPSNVLSAAEGSWGQCLVCGHDHPLDEPSGGL